MADVVNLKEKVERVCRLNSLLNRDAPRNRTHLSDWLGIGRGTLTERYGMPKANLHAALERAIVMALGFGPEDREFERGDYAWASWTATWSNLWRMGAPEEFVERLESSGYFVPRLPSDPRLGALLPKIRRKKKDHSAFTADLSRAKPAWVVARTDGRFLDRLASLDVACIPQEPGSYRVMATCTFGADVEIPTDDATYLVSIRHCRLEMLLREATFEPKLEKKTARSQSQPVHEIKIERETSRLNHPSWRLSDPRPKTPIHGEYSELVLGTAHGTISADDEASILVYKAGFAVSAASGVPMDEGGILTSLLKYLVTEYVGQIEQRGAYIYHLSVGPIALRGHDD